MWSLRVQNERGHAMNSQNPHIGSSLDDLLREEGILYPAPSVAIEEALTFQFQNDPADVKSAEKERD